MSAGKRSPSHAAHPVNSSRSGPQHGQLREQRPHDRTARAGSDILASPGNGDASGRRTGRRADSQVRTSEPFVAYRMRGTRTRVNLSMRAIRHLEVARKGDVITVDARAWYPTGR
jgi:hypothetical protein